MTDLSLPILGARVQLEGVETLDQATSKARTAEQAFDAITGAATKTAAATKATSVEADRAAVGFGQHGKAIRDAAGAHGELQKAVGLTRMQMMELTHVGRSMFDMMSAGISPMRAVQVEGARIVQVLSSGPAGVSGTISALVRQLPALATGYVGLGAASAAAAGIAVTSFARWRSSQDELYRSMNGMGQASGLGIGGLNSIADLTASARGGYSSYEARHAVATFNRAGLDPSTIAGLSEVSPTFARATGQDFGGAADQLAAAFEDPTRGAADLQKQFALLSDATKQLISAQQAAGNVEGARATLLQALDANVATQIDPRNPIGMLVDAVKAGVSNAYGFVGEGINAGLGLDVSSRPMDKVYGDAGPPSQYESNSGEAAIIRPQMAGDPNAIMQGWERLTSEAAKRLSLSKTLEDNILSIQAGNAVRGISPEIGERMDLTSTKSLLQRALGDPDVMRKLGATSTEVSHAIDLTATRLVNLKSAADQVRESTALDIVVTNTRTAADRTSAEALRTFNQVLLQSGDAAKAAAAAEAVRAQAIANATRTLFDASRSASDALRLAGASPYQQAVIRAGFAARDLREQTAIGDGGSNNPGNLENRPFVANMPGYTGGGRFATFATIDDGFRAANANLDSYARQGITTPAAILQKWAPAADHNDPVAYAATIRKLTGLDPGAPLGTDPWSRAVMLRAMSQVEHGAVPGQSTAQVAAMLGAGGYSPTMERANAATRSQVNTDTLAAIPREMVQGPLDQAKRDLDAQNLALQKQRDTWTKMPGDIAASAKQAEILGGWIKEGYPYTEKDAAAALDMAKHYGTAAQAAADFAMQQQRAIGFTDQLRGSVSDVTGAVKVLAHGGSLRDAGRSLLGNTEDRVIDFLSKEGSNALLGAPGTAGAGSLFGKTVTSTAAAAATQGGGIIQALFGLSHLFGFADGGVMTPIGPVPLRRYASGGIANSPQLALFGEGKGAEAYVPLADGRSIPVTMRGAPTRLAGAPAMHYNDNRTIHMPPGVTIDQVEAVMARERKHTERHIGGMLASWQHRYG